MFSHDMRCCSTVSDRLHLLHHFLWSSSELLHGVQKLTAIYRFIKAASCMCLQLFCTVLGLSESQLHVFIVIGIH